MTKPYKVEPMLKMGEFWPYRNKEYLAGYYISYRSKNVYFFKGWDREIVDKICQYLNDAFEKGKMFPEPLPPPADNISRLEAEKMKVEAEIDNIKAEIKRLERLRDHLIRESTLPK